MQTKSGKQFLFGVCITAFFILSLNSKIAGLMAFSLLIYICFTVIVLRNLISCLVGRRYNKQQLRAMEKLSKRIEQSILERKKIHMLSNALSGIVENTPEEAQLSSIREAMEAEKQRIDDLMTVYDVWGRLGWLHGNLILLSTRLPISLTEPTFIE
jgi:Flp pilus assembly protein TadB